MVRGTAMRVARKIPNHIGIDDLIGQGWLGLVEAFARTDAEVGPDELTAYVSFRVRGAMLDYLRHIDPATRRVRALSRRVRHTSASLQRSLGRPAESHELAAALGLTMEAYHRVVLTLSRSEPTHSDGTETDELVADATPIDEVVLQRLRGADVMRAVATLPPRLQHLLDLYYQEGATLREIGAAFGVTESRVSQLHSDAMRRLRDALGDA